jgi:hypothetical protein
VLNFLTAVDCFCPSTCNPKDRYYLNDNFTGSVLNVNKLLDSCFKILKDIIWYPSRASDINDDDDDDEEIPSDTDEEIDKEEAKPASSTIVRKRKLKLDEYPEVLKKRHTSFTD